MAQWEFNRGAALLERLGVAGQADVVNLYAARAARGFGDGFAAIILPAYLLEIGFNPFQIGLVATSALLGCCWRGSTTGSVAPIYLVKRKNPTEVSSDGTSFTRPHRTPGASIQWRL
jgi:hypothetical protein